jgi:hypothetical protein
MTAEAFTKENRVRLFFQIKDSLNSDHGGGLKSFQTLEDLLKRDLGRLELAKAYDLESRIQNFVLSAPENELLTVIEFVPIAHYGAKTEGRSNAP